MSPATTSTSIEDEIITLETAYWDSIKDSDVEASLALTHDPCIVAGPQGAALIDHAAFSKMSEKKTWSLNDYSIDKMNVQAIGQNVFVLGYTIKLEMEAEGKPVSMNCAETSTWVKTDGRWQCAQHSETILGDPYGRDKAANGSEKKSEKAK